LPNFARFDAGMLKLQQMIKWDVFWGDTDTAAAAATLTSEHVYLSQWQTRRQDRHRQDRQANRDRQRVIQLNLHFTLVHIQFKRHFKKSVSQ